MDTTQSQFLANELNVQFGLGSSLKYMILLSCYCNILAYSF